MKLKISGASQVALVVKNLPASAGDIKDTGSIPGLGRSPGGGHCSPLQYSCLENPMDREACVHEVTESWTQLKRLSIHTHTHTHTHAYWHKAPLPLCNPDPALCSLPWPLLLGESSGVAWGLSAPKRDWRPDIPKHTGELQRKEGLKYLWLCGYRHPRHCATWPCAGRGTQIQLTESGQDSQWERKTNTM